MTLCALQAIAREAVGKDRPHKEVEDWCNEVWGKPLSPGINATPNRKRRQEDWVERMARADGRVKKTRTEDTHADTCLIEKENGEREPNDENLDVCKRSTSNLEQRAKSRVFESITNVLADPRGSLAPSVPSSSTLAPGNTPTDNLRAPLPTIKEAVGLPHNPIHDQLREEVLQQPKSLILIIKDLQEPTTRTITPTEQSSSANSTSFTSTLNGLSPITPKCKYADTSLGRFLNTAVVWILQRPGSSRPSWRVPSSNIICPGHQVHSFDAFIMACSWSLSTAFRDPGDKNSAGIAACGWAERGVLFVDESDSTWVDGILKRLIEQRARFLQWSISNGGGSARCKPKPVWVLSMACLRLEEVVKESDIESQALCRLG
jgi:DNA ligase 4